MHCEALVVAVTPLAALAYSFLFGLLHGVLPDEHTWPITFSYAIGGASGREGMKAGLFFSAAFTIQRMLISELAYLALAPFLLSSSINGVVYIVVGLAMSAAGAVVLSRNRYPHLHVVGHHHEEPMPKETTRDLFGRHHSQMKDSAPPPTHWAIIHGFIAGFGFGPFALFIYTTAAPHMSSPWTGFLPGLLFGMGTMIMLMILGGLFGSTLRLTKRFNEGEIRVIGFNTASWTLLLGGAVFAFGGLYGFAQDASGHPVDIGNILVAIIMLGVAIPVLAYSIWKVVHCQKIGIQPLKDS